MKNITTNLLSIFLCGSILHACSSSDKTLIPPSPNFEEEEIKEITPKILELADDMLETMYEANGVGPVSYTHLTLPTIA